MSDHQEQPQVVSMGRQPSAQNVINRLNERLNQKANDIRVLEDREVAHIAMIDDMTGEIAAMTAMMDQVTKENQILRKRLDLPALGAIEFSEEEQAEGQQVPVESESESEGAEQPVDEN